MGREGWRDREGEREGWEERDGERGRARGRHWKRGDGEIGSEGVMRE